jgi:hypothetical protein
MEIPAAASGRGASLGHPASDATAIKSWLKRRQRLFDLEGFRRRLELSRCGHLAHPETVFVEARGRKPRCGGGRWSCNSGNSSRRKSCRPGVRHADQRSYDSAGRPALSEFVSNLRLNTSVGGGNTQNMRKLINELRFNSPCLGLRLGRATSGSIPIVDPNIFFRNVSGALNNRAIS